MTETTVPYAGVPIRDQDVRLDVTPEQALAAGRSQRGRLASAVAGLSEAEWTTPSRCAGWTVQDVVRHLVHVGDLQRESLAAARTGERWDGFSAAKFSPRETPVAYLTERGSEPIETTAAAFAERTAAVLDALDEMASVDPTAETLLVSTPIGRQPWHRAALHGLFDSAVHERDILAPLGRRPEPAPPADEVRAIASYHLLLVTRVLAVVGAPVDLALRLTGGPDLRVRIDGAVVSVGSGDLDGAALSASGPVDEVLDAMVGRGDLAAVLDGPPEVAMGLSALSSLV